MVRGRPQQWSRKAPRTLATVHGARGQDCAARFVHVISLTVWQGCDHRHCTPGETEAPRGEVVWPRSHSLGAKHQAAQESSGWPCSGSSPNSPSGQLLPSLRLSFPCCTAGVTHHAGMGFKVVAKPNLVCVTWSSVALCAEHTLRRLGCV